MAADNDPKGFYQRLGIQPSASAEEIKAAYRELAKKLHPDINKNENAKALFQAISEAYGVLGDPELRASYDTLRYARPSPQTQEREIEPICCSRCGKITAQPRSTVFYRVVSAFIVTFRTPIQGIFCSACAKKASLGASLISALFGWWGFPWGPIWTISSILGNAKGGRFSKEVDDKLIWYNAVAFLSKGKLEISYALAQQARKASDEDIALNALRLMDQLRAQGLSATAGTLKDPWRTQPITVLAHVMLLAALPTAFAALIYTDETDRKASRSQSAPSAQAQPYQYQRPIAKIGEAPPGYSVSPPLVTPSPIPICARPPINGQILSKAIPLNERGHVIEIQNGATANAIIKVRNAYNGSVAVSFFVEKGMSASIANLPDGQYRIQYAFGDAFRSDCRSFVQIIAASQFPDADSLRTEYTQTQVSRSRVRYTLYTVPNGNIRPETLSINAFNAD
jgi:hypothetical protein